MNDKHVGNVEMVKLPNNLKYRFYWIVGKNKNGRYLARTPKIGVLIRNLHKKRETDFNTSIQTFPKDILFLHSQSVKNKRKTKMRKTKKNK
jgi:hypothetical protein